MLDVYARPHTYEIQKLYFNFKWNDGTAGKTLFYDFVPLVRGLFVRGKGHCSQLILITNENVLLPLDLLILDQKLLSRVTDGFRSPISNHNGRVGGKMEEWR